MDKEIERRISAVPCPKCGRPMNIHRFGYFSDIYRCAGCSVNTSVEWNKDRVRPFMKIKERR
jgi:endogenous inhibitor of DNA gyrase (YacG/DUF329 family)